MSRLAGAASLYLRQHADNPVDWWQWGDAPFAEAQRRDVPVLVSIGYAACHWCHVMAHESFEDPAIAELVNEVCVPIKVDREERPDVDARYMAATQAMTGQGGWPMTVVCTPAGDPFFAGTYFPPVPRHGMPSFRQVLSSVRDVWATRRGDVLDQAARLAEAVRADASLPDTLVPTGPAPGSRARRVALLEALRARFDPVEGGFSPAPKFPHPAYVEACLASWVATGDDASLGMAVRTLDAMARGGLFDHVAGGFARYSVDATWTVPHFEKMLTDQALLARAYLRAAAWCDVPAFAWVARRTLDFVLSHMATVDGFASAIDADAGGHEGAHVVLRADDARRALDDAGLAHLAARTIARYHLGDDGPVDGRCVPRLDSSADLVGDEDDQRARDALLAWREGLAKPAVDDKVLLEWNAMLASVLAEAAWRLGEDRYAAAAARLVGSLAQTHLVGDRWRRRAGADAPLATCADLAWLVDAHVSLFELDGDGAHLGHARQVADALLAGYFDGTVPTAAHPDEGRGLFQSHAGATGPLVRAKDVLDGATPSGTSVAAVALARLALVTADDDVRAVAERLVTLCDPVLDHQPTAAATLLEAAALLHDGVEVVVPGARTAMLDAVRRRVGPCSVLVHGDAPLALLGGRTPGVLYVCHRATCDLPVAEVGSVASALATAARWEDRR